MCRVHAIYLVSFLAGLLAVLMKTGFLNRELHFTLKVGRRLVFFSVLLFFQTNGKFKLESNRFCQQIEQNSQLYYTIPQYHLISIGSILTLTTQIFMRLGLKLVLILTCQCLSKRNKQGSHMSYQCQCYFVV